MCREIFFVHKWGFFFTCKEKLDFLHTSGKKGVWIKRIECLEKGFEQVRNEKEQYDKYLLFSSF